MVDLKIYFLLDFNEAESKSYLPFDHTIFLYIFKYALHDFDHFYFTKQQIIKKKIEPIYQ